MEWVKIPSSNFKMFCAFSIAINVRQWSEPRSFDLIHSSKCFLCNFMPMEFHNMSFFTLIRNCNDKSLVVPAAECSINRKAVMVCNCIILNFFICILRWSEPVYSKQGNSFMKVYSIPFDIHTLPYTQLYNKTHDVR